MKNNIKTYLCLLLILYGCRHAQALTDAEEGMDIPRLEETIVVTASLLPAALHQINREVVIIDSDRLRQLPVRSVNDLLVYLPQLDVQPRVAGGLFGDVHIRGSVSAGVLICINGIRWNDPQTAHFNLEIPVPLEAIERVEVLTGSHTAFFGSDAVGGVVNIVTRKKYPDQVRTDLRSGSFGMRGLSFFGSAGSPRIQSGIFLGTDRSDGFITNRDFRIDRFFGDMSVSHAWGDIHGLFTWLHNRFGADGFYGPYPSYEETRTHALLLDCRLNQGIFKNRPTQINLAYKRHSDDFILVRDNPLLYRNNHQTTVTRFKATSQLWQGKRTAVAIGAEAERCGIVGERLGNHAFTQLAMASEVRHELSERTHLQGSLRVEHQSAYGFRWSPGLGIATFLTPRFKVRSAYGKAFRTPSFTELYYESPANLGNPDLKPETADSFEVGWGWYPSNETSISFTAYRRWDREMIDWVRQHPDNPWQAVNIGRVDVCGTSVMIDFQPVSAFRCQTGYTYNNLNAGRTNFESKYALDYARHHFSVLADFAVRRNLTLSAAVHHKHRSMGQSSYTLAGARLAYRRKVFEFFIQSDNLLNQTYEELKGVPMPRRSFTAGVKLFKVFE